MRQPSVVFAAIVAALLAGCGDDEEAAPAGPSQLDSTTKVEPSTPLGSVAGTVLDGQGRPLEGAEVALQLGVAPAPATTDAAGHFQFTGVPAGSSVGVEIRKQGYATAYRAATIPATAGNFPVNDASAFVGPVVLYELSGALTLAVIGFDGRSVTPAGAWCEASASFADRASGVEVPLGPLLVEGAPGAGTLSCSGLPRLVDLVRVGGSIDVWVPAQDADNDGTADYDGVAWTVSAADAMAAGAGTALVLPVAGHLEPLRIVATNVRSLVDGPSAILASSIAATASILVSFSRRVEVVEATLFDETGQEAIAVASQVSPSGSSVSLTPGAQAWPEGQELNLVLTVATNDGARQAGTFAAPLLTRPGAVPLAVDGRAPGGGAGFFFDDEDLSFTLDPGERVTIAFTQAVGAGTGAAFQLPVYFETNLNVVDGPTIGDSYAEVGSGQPARAVSVEPDSGVAAASGFTTQFALVWDGAYPVPSGVNLVVAFDDARAGAVFATDGNPVANPLQAQLVQRAP